MPTYNCHYPEIPNDDKLIIRRKIKDGDKDITSLFDAHKKEKNFTDLQIKLRKIIVTLKGQEKRNTINYHGRDSKNS